MYFDSLDAVDDYIEPGQSYSDIRLVACDSVYTPKLDIDFFSWICDEDYHLPEIVNEAIEQFNKSVEGVVINWTPGKKRIKDKCQAEESTQK